ncbi:TonB-dependent receptor [Tenacibaculum finnmarkense]|uniref:TonB-dependent receptor n=1 Tax=Tenacibaculum finnmarkense TaxID=2781243 RepID=UPI00187B1A6D|nr:TonB-dependent receptor [Tenacibaculum finnmarkense]MBE7692213.1 TonB-dependent receptor plug domain-containing protein [Tenacibaculum finnmarkense genomovar finnmarkense]MCG8805136.1 TonB-dependent receptor [Tenacibaculum finnmarkense]MCG8855435.1 TonB-dependent receptor [Tenacibaculum finnmarkense]
MKLKDKSFLVYVILLFGVFNILFAQEKLTTISGKILDNKNKPLLGVNIYLDGTKKGSVTNFNGEYIIKNIIQKPYTLVVSIVGFKTQRKIINTQFNIYNFKLQEDINLIDEVTVKAKTKAEKIENQGFNVKSVAISKIKTQRLEINKILDYSPGVRVRTTGGVGSDFDYRLNGMSGKAIKFFIDEIPMDYYGASYAINNIPIGLINSVDIYKGVVPIKLGTDALGGAINLVTNKNVNNFLEGAISVGSFHTLQSTLNGKFRLDSGFTTKFAFFSTYSENNYKVWGSGVNYADKSTGYKAVNFTKKNPAERFNDDFQTLTAKVDVGYTNKKWADQFYIGLLASDLKKGVQTGQTMGTVYGKVRNKKKTLMPNIVYKKNNFLKKGLDVGVFTAYSYNQGVLIDTSLVQYDWRNKVVGQPRIAGGETSYYGKSLYTQKDYSQVYRLNVSYKLPLNLKIGVNYLYEHNKSKGAEKFPNKRFERKAYTVPQRLEKHFGGLALETKKFNNKLNVNMFIKYFGYNTRINDLIYTTQYEVNEIKNKLDDWGMGFATSFKITPNFLIKLSSEKATRMPSPTEALGDGITILNSPFLKPEQSINVNFGVVLGRYNFGNHGVKFAMNSFYNDTKDKITFLVNTARGFGNFINLERISGKGVDIDITYDFKQKLKLNLNATYTDLRNNNEFDIQGNKNIVYQDRLRNEPYFMANAGLEYNLNDFIQKDSKLFTYISSNYVHEFFLDWPSLGNKATKSIIPTQLVFDAGIGYHFPSKKLTLAFDASNILNEQVYDNYLLQKPGRAFFLKATYQFIKK